MTTARTRLVCATTATAAAVTLALFTPAAQAENTGTAAKGTTTAASTVTLKFDKNQKHASYSKLSVIKGTKVWANFRAGSGTTQDECESEHGWLPNGTYTIRSHSRTYNGDLIKGYAIRLSDKVCSNGRTNRDSLFIHSEMNRNGSQGSPEPRQWTDNNPNDFLSKGCIKMQPEKIKELFRLLDRIGWPKTLKVVN
ncbi:L,D-transpeptidase (plasmid) [Streptomyces sp. NBC_00984]|uniref:L,D-transpeptidase n=1 Tax=Streptomyces sp. NBC_00984 TaxID=2903700 RepID=UPI003862F3F5|nr:L,D-transpeptidase [Streptomyces sp. NBC_00984]